MRSGRKKKVEIFPGSFTVGRVTDKIRWDGIPYPAVALDVASLALQGQTRGKASELEATEGQLEKIKYCASSIGWMDVLAVPARGNPGNISSGAAKGA